MFCQEILNFLKIKFKSDTKNIIKNLQNVNKDKLRTH